jgi:hypothetical protein
MKTYVIGGGLAGLTIALNLAMKKQDVILLERYKAFGGRVVTYRENGLQYEIGAGRINKTHTRVNALVKEFGLHTFPITNESYFDTKPNPFDDLFGPIRDLLRTLPNSELQTKTIGDLVPESLQPLLRMYPYDAEIHMMRADIALPLFESKAEMGPSSEYYGVVEGLDTITTKLAEQAMRAGALLKNRHRVHDIIRQEDNTFKIIGDYGKKAEAKPFEYIADRVIIATCRCSLSDFSVLKDAPLLKQLNTSPLIRVYAQYPPNADGKVWFHDIKKTVTDASLRYIIPINPDKGLIMISYTDGEDTKEWMDVDERMLVTKIAAATAAQFPDKTIPPPAYIKSHEWPSGCTYWLPGTYNVREASRAAMNPGPNVYVCGESISLTQAWMEGALESAEALIKLLDTA